MAWISGFPRHDSKTACVLVPNSNAVVQDLGPFLSGRSMLTDILPGSALICVSDGNAPLVDDKGFVFFAFEGNNNGAVNLERYHEKCLCAAGRLAHRHPSIAYGRARLMDLQVVARYDLERFVFDEILDQNLLEEWSGETIASFLPPPIATPCSDLEIITPLLGLPMRPVWMDHSTALIWKMEDGSVVVKTPEAPVCIYSPQDVELKSIVENLDMDARITASLLGRHQQEAQDPSP